MTLMDIIRDKKMTREQLQKAALDYISEYDGYQHKISKDVWDRYMENTGKEGVRIARPDNPDDYVSP